MLDKLYILVELLVITMCISKLYGKRYELDYKTIVLFMIDMIVLQGINEGYLPAVSSIMVYLLIIVYCCVKYKQGIKSAIINTILAFFILSLLQILSAICVGLLLSGVLRERLVLLITNLFMVAAFLVLSKLVSLKNLSHFLQRKDITLYIVLVSGTFGIIYSIYMAKFYEGVYLGLYFFTCLIIVIVCVMAGSWESYKIKAIEREMELKTYKLYEDSYKKLITDIRMRQHDFKSHINTIYTQHVMCDTYEELVERQKKYCSEVLADNRFDELLKAGDSMIIGFLYGVFTDAGNKGIDVKYDIKIDKLNINIPLYKVIAILGNLIDNAIEALEDSNEKGLYVGIIEEKEHFNIEVRNTNKYIEWDDVDKLFKKGYSTKDENRGLGLYNIKKMSQEYDFEVIFSNKEIEGNNWVCFEIDIKKRLS